MVVVGESKSERRMRLKMKEKINDEYMKWSRREDPFETLRRSQLVEEMVRAAMKQVPWNMMDKHLHSDEARKYHEETCNLIRSTFERVPIIATCKSFNRHIYIYTALKHRTTSSEDWSIAKLMQEKLHQLNGKINTYSFLLGVGVGAAVMAAAVAGVAVWRKKYAEVGTVSSDCCD